MNGKGDKRRPTLVSDEHVKAEWDRLFPSTVHVEFLETLEKLHRTIGELEKRNK